MTDAARIEVVIFLYILLVGVLVGWWVGLQLVGGQDDTTSHPDEPA